MAAAAQGTSLKSYLLTRLLLVVPMVLILLTFVFLLMRVAPGDPISASLGGHAPPSVIADIKHRLGFDAPLWRQYIDYLGQIVRGDFGHTILRQLFVDCWLAGVWPRLAASASDADVRGVAEKAVKENAYHLRHSSAWVVRLGDGTEESHARMLAALDALWPYRGENEITPGEMTIKAGTQVTFLIEDSNHQPYNNVGTNQFTAPDDLDDGDSYVFTFTQVGTVTILCTPHENMIATINVALAIITEATLSFLGVGLHPTEPSLGTMIQVGNKYLFSGSWWMVAFPGLTLAALALAVNLLGDWLRDALNPKLR